MLGRTRSRRSSARTTPAEITDAGKAWIRLHLTDPETGLSTTESMGFSDFANLVLHWRKHGCHRHSCSVLHMAEGNDD